MVHQTIDVKLGDRSYPIYLGAGILGLLGSYCRQHSMPTHLVVLADRNSARAAGKPVTASLESAGFDVSLIVMPPGERQKSVARAEAIHTAMLKRRFPRTGAMIALGGGVVGDVAGFVASTYRRGIRFVQCPTTLLSQVDSSVGGKNGVNHPRSKNAIGTYHQPAFVLSDVDVLRSLPRRDVIAGLGEILKYPIVGDPSLLDTLETNLRPLLAVDRDIVLEIAVRCLRIKADLVSQDERELLSDRGRVFLNVGHAIGHALETLSHYRLRHGEAVLLGILAEGFIAVRQEGFSEADFGRLVEIYHRLGRRLSIRQISDGAIVRSVNRKSGVRFVLPRRLGEVAVLRNITEEQIREGLRFLREL